MAMKHHVISSPDKGMLCGHLAHMGLFLMYRHTSHGDGLLFCLLSSMLVIISHLRSF